MVGVDGADLWVVAVRRWWRLGPPAGISVLLGVGVALLVNLLTSGRSWPVFVGLAVAVLVVWDFCA